MTSEYVLAAEAPIVAEVYDPKTGDLVDGCYSWEAGQNYARGNYKVVAILPDTGISVEEMQAIFNQEREWSQDCWGLDDETAMEEW